MSSFQEPRAPTIMSPGREVLEHGRTHQHTAVALETVADRLPIPAPVPTRWRHAKRLRIGVVVLLVLGGLASSQTVLEAARPEHLYHQDAPKDLIQEYLLALAIVNGTDPYDPINTMAAQYLGISLDHAYPHPTAHPPPMALLAVPLTLFDYETAATVWLGVEIVCLAAALHLLARTAGLRPPLWKLLLATCAALAWYPVQDELRLGQLMLPILLLIVATRLAVLRGWPILGGMLLGLAVLIKPVPWPLLLVFVFRREWGALAASVAVLLVGYGAAGWVMGFEPIIAYPMSVLPGVVDPFRGSVLNISAWALGWRLFQGTGSPIHTWVAAPPLIESSTAATIVSVGVPTCLLLAVCRWLRGQRRLNPSVGMMVCVSMLISPLMWCHYLVLILLPAAELARWLTTASVPVRRQIVFLLALAVLSVPCPAWTQLAFLLSTPWLDAAAPTVLPFSAALLTLTPSLAVGALAYLLTRLAEDAQRVNLA